MDFEQEAAAFVEAQGELDRYQKMFMKDDLTELLKRVYKQGLEDAAHISVVGRTTTKEKRFQEGWFSGTEDMQAAIEAKIKEL